MFSFQMMYTSKCNTKMTLMTGFVVQGYALISNSIYFDIEERVNEITPGYYDDVITDGLKTDNETGAVLYCSCNSTGQIY